MWSRWICAAAICFGLAPQAEASEHSGLVHRASCAVVRSYVARYTASAAEMWARSHGATDAEIEAARHFLKSAPAQTAQGVTGIPVTPTTSTHSLGPRSKLAGPFSVGNMPSYIARAS
jgi:hypothetical protein